MRSCYGRILTKAELESILETFKIKDSELYRKWERGGKWKLVENKNNCDGYCLVGFQNKRMYFHRLIYILSKKADIPAGHMLDHVDGDKLNNNIENLRIVTNRENLQNRESHRLGSLVGASFYKRYNKWLSQIVINSKKINLGYYATEQEASAQYLLAVQYIDEFDNNKQFRQLLKTKQLTVGGILNG